jgi:hypothetical protein
MLDDIRSRGVIDGHDADRQVAAPGIQLVSMVTGLIQRDPLVRTVVIAPRLATAAHAVVRAEQPGPGVG